jgi:enamine deaminase RidA (YjgF/YER057c/UK114 family)
MAEPALPTSPVPQGRYAPAVVHDGVAYSAGMTPRADGALVITGRVGAEVGQDDARRAAGLAARNALAAIASAVGGIDNIVRCLRMTVYVAAVSGFTEYSAVADGASAALADLLGDCAEVARAAVGVHGLPGGAPVEVELTAAVAAE